MDMRTEPTPKICTPWRNVKVGEIYNLTRPARERTQGAGLYMPDKLPTKPKKPASPGSFKPGHPGYMNAGRGPGHQKLVSAREAAEKIGFHPVEFLAMVAHFGQMPNANGTTTECSPEMRLDAAKSVAPYLVPKLQQTQVTGKDGGPVEVTPLVSVDMILSNPELARKAQEVALEIASSAQRKALGPGSGS